METSLNKSILEIEKILKYIKITQQEKLILQKIIKIPDTDKEEIKELLNLKKTGTNRIMYKSNHYTFIIITLYGILENYLENFIEEYINSLKVLYMKKEILIDKKIKNIHNKTCIKFLESLPRKYEHVLNRNIIIESLYSVEQENYEKLNSKMFTYHEANFRKNSINDLFGKININNIVNKIEKDAVFISEWKQNNVDFDIAFLLDDLAQRRNVLSHGGVLDDILDLNVLRIYTNLISIFINRFNILVNEKLLKNKIIYEIESKNYNKLNVIQIIDNRILCIEHKKDCICKNRSIIIIKKQNNDTIKYEFSKIKQMQINNSSFNYIPFSNNLEKIGLELSHRLNEHYSYYLFTN